MHPLGTCKNHEARGPELWEGTQWWVLTSRPADVRAVSTRETLHSMPWAPYVVTITRYHLFSLPSYWKGLYSCLLLFKTAKFRCLLKKKMNDPLAMCTSRAFIYSESIKPLPSWLMWHTYTHATKAHKRWSLCPFTLGRRPSPPLSSDVLITWLPVLIWCSLWTTPLKWVTYYIWACLVRVTLARAGPELWGGWG